MMTGIRVQHRSESAFTFDRNGRSGWAGIRNSLKVGDQITVEGYLAKDGSKMANARSATLADGRKVFAGSSGDGGPR